MRLRFRYRKLGKVRFTSHRDVARLWERALRRAALPVATSEGFSPRPKVHFGLALSTGYESLAEFVDVDLRAEVPTGCSGELAAQLSALLPPGLEVDAVAPVDRGSPSLQQAVTSCTWLFELPEVAPAALHAQVDAVLAAATLPVVRERKGKQVDDDLRPTILELSVTDVADPRWPVTAHVAGGGPGGDGRLGGFLRAELATQPRGVRPLELLAVLDPPPRPGRICRTHQWIGSDGARWEPLPDATRPPHAEARAS